MLVVPFLLIVDGRIVKRIFFGSIPALLSSDGAYS